MIDIRYYTIIIRKDRSNSNLEELFKDYIGPKNEDKDLLSFYTMSEDIRDEILNKLSIQVGLKGFSKGKDQWEDFVLVTSIDGIEKGRCDWLDFRTTRSKQGSDLFTHVFFVNR